MIPGFKTALEAWLAKAQAIVDKGHESYPNLTRPVLKLDPGRRYIRVVREDDSRSVHCFIDTTNGDVLKAEGWKKPAKHARGNIFTDVVGVTQYGGTYLK